MATYRHKKLWWIAEEYFKSWKFYIYQKNDDWTEKELAHNVLPELIWSDRELVEERDWIDKAYEYFEKDNRCLISKETFREIIVSFAPKQKKFIREEVGDRQAEYDFADWVWDKVILFLNDNNLLSHSDE